MIKQQFENYRLWLQEQGLAYQSQRAYTSHIRGFLDFLQNSQEPFSEVQRYVTHLQRESAKTSTIQAKITAITHFAKYCGQHVEIARELESECSVVETIENSDAERLLKVVDQSPNARDKAIFYLLFYTGMRPSECCAVDPSWFDFVQGTIKVTAPCTGKTRVVKMHLELQSVIQAWMHGQSLIQHSQSRALFLTNSGKKISPQIIDNVVRKFGVQARLVISARTLRNTFLQNLAIESCSVQTVAKIGGHRRPGLAKRYFQQAMPTSTVVFAGPALSHVASAN